MQEVYAHIEGQFVPLSVVGTYPDVTEPEWEAERKRIRRAGAAYLADGAKAATARYIQAARREIITATQHTKTMKSARRRREREGTSHADASPQAPAAEPVIWRPVSEVEEKGWLKWLN